MRGSESFKRQKFFLLLLTLSILAAAILLLSFREQAHHELFSQIGNHQSAIYHVEKAKQELLAIKQQLLLRQLSHRLDPGNIEALSVISALDGFNNSVSIHALRGHAADIVALQKRTGSHGPLSLKLERQLDNLLPSDGRLDMGRVSGLDELKRQIEGLILSMEQLEGFHGLHIKAVADRQARNTRQDTIVMIFMISILVLLSYLSIAGIMGRIRSMIEEQNELARKLERQNAELERFTYTVSHDLKSPLVTIKNFIGMLERNVRADDRRGAYQDIDRISAAADDMAALLEGLLELSRIGSIVNPPQSGRLSELVERVVDKLRSKIEAHGVELQIDEAMPDYWGDGLRLQQVFQNLIENSIKFMGDQTSPLIRIGAHEEHGEVICSVSDNGIGIDPHYQNRVFNLFERLDQSIDGTGIGLALVQRIVEAHGGRVWIESPGDGPGCTVVFALPVRPEEAESTAA